MRRALFAVTEGGIKLGLKISDKLSCDIYSMDKYCESYRVLPLKGSLKEAMKTAFEAYDEIIMVMSCGIAVRSIAPYIESKLTDPAVVVCDETGRFAVSLLSGHLGGANSLAEAVAACVGGIAVITTASDRLGLEAVDMLAQRLGCAIESFEAAKQVTSVMINGGRVGLLAEDIKAECAGAVSVTWEQFDGTQLDALIHIGLKRVDRLSDIGIPVARLFPRQLVLGVGCRKNTDKQKLLKAVYSFIEENRLSVKAISKVATIDIKKDEPAINHIAEVLGVELAIVGSDKIAAVEDKFDKSDFVKRSVGVGSVCEPAAFITSGEGECLVHKTKYEGITLCVYKAAFLEV